MFEAMLHAFYIHSHYEYRLIFTKKLLYHTRPKFKFRPKLGLSLIICPQMSVLSIVIQGQMAVSPSD